MSYIMSILKASLNTPFDLWERELHSVELHNLQSSPNIKAYYDDKSKTGQVAHMGDKVMDTKYCQKKELWEQTTWETVEDGRIIFKLILKRE